MAKVKFGAIATDVRNKVGGIVYSKNRYGSYIRAKVSPVQPRTQAQVEARNSFRLLAQKWANELTESQRAAWETFAKDHKVTDVFGNSLELSGISMFQRVNRGIMEVGGNIVVNAPSNFSVDSITSASVVASVADQKLEISFEATGNNFDTLYVWATEALPSGVNYVKNRLRMISDYEIGNMSPQNLFSQYVSRFGMPSVGQRIGLLVSTLNQSNGATSAGVPLFVIFE